MLRSNEIKKAETFWLKQTQTETFPNGTAEKSLERLNPQKDDDGLLRADGHLRYVDDHPFEVRHPILLAKDHPVTQLIVVSTHETCTWILRGTCLNPPN